MKSRNIYKHHRFPPEIISHCVWLYYRFSLSYRDIELMMQYKGVDVTFASVRFWCLKFGKVFVLKGFVKNKRFLNVFIWMKFIVRLTGNGIVFGVL